MRTPASVEGSAWRGARRWAVASVLVAFVLAACSSSGGSTKAAGGSKGKGGAGATHSTAKTVYPVPDWVQSDPKAEGLDPAALQKAADLAEQRGSNCLVVTRDGRLVDEWYWNGTTKTSEQEVFSATKSYTSALVGIAQDQGKLKVGDSAAKYIPEWKGTPSEKVTIRDLLSNDSGRFWDFTTDYLKMAAEAKDKTAFAVGLAQQRDPGTYWEYNNSAIQTLDAVLKKSTGMDVAEFAGRYLFTPLGMASHMSHDAAGNTLTFMGLQASCRDMARFGYLYLRGGQWADGKRVIAKSWVQESTRPSTRLNASYGYLWWLNANGHWVDGSLPTGRPEGDGPRVPGLAENVFSAQGLGEQIVAVYPSSGIVMARLGPNTLNPNDLLGTNFIGDLQRQVQDAVVK